MKRYSKHQKDGVISDRIAGVSFKEIISKHGVCKSTICKWVSESGLFKPHPTPKRVSDEIILNHLRNTEIISYANIIEKIGARMGGATYSRIRNVIKKHNVDTSHMRGQGWMRERKIYKPINWQSLIGRRVATHNLKLRLIKFKIKEHRCESCGLSEWKSNPIPLELHHINGSRLDNNLSNLQILCPNCHAMTDNYCGRNIGKYAVVAKPETAAVSKTAVP